MKLVDRKDTSCGTGGSLHSLLEDISSHLCRVALWNRSCSWIGRFFFISFPSFEISCRFSISFALIWSIFLVCFSLF